MKIRGSPLYCKDDERPRKPLSACADGKAGVRPIPSQETGRLLQVYRFSVGKNMGTIVRFVHGLYVQRFCLKVPRLGGLFL